MEECDTGWMTSGHQLFGRTMLTASPASTPLRPVITSVKGICYE